MIAIVCYKAAILLSHNFTSVGDSSDSGDAESMEDYKGDSDAEVYDAGKDIEKMLYNSYNNDVSEYIKGRETKWTNPKSSMGNCLKCPEM